MRRRALFGAAAAAPFAGLPSIDAANLSVNALPAHPDTISTDIAADVFIWFQCVSGIPCIDIKRMSVILNDFDSAVTKALEHPHCHRSLLSALRKAKEVWHLSFGNAGSILIGNLISPEWDKAEKRFITRNAKPGCDEQVMPDRRKIVECMVSRAGLTGCQLTTPIAEPLRIITGKTAETMHGLLHAAYQRDSIGLVTTIHEHPANFGIGIHQALAGSVTDQSILDLVPRSIIEHVAATYHLTSAPKPSQSFIHIADAQIVSLPDGRLLLAHSIGDVRKMIKLVGGVVTAIADDTIEDTGLGVIVRPETAAAIRAERAKLSEAQAPPALALPVPHREISCAGPQAALASTAALG